jgi:hypothetical protein
MGSPARDDRVRPGPVIPGRHPLLGRLLRQPRPLPRRRRPGICSFTEEGYQQDRRSHLPAACRRRPSQLWTRGGQGWGDGAGRYGTGIVPRRRERASADRHLMSVWRLLRGHGQLTGPSRGSSSLTGGWSGGGLAGGADGRGRRRSTAYRWGTGSDPEDGGWNVGATHSAIPREGTSVWMGRRGEHIRLHLWWTYVTENRGQGASPSRGRRDAVSPRKRAETGQESSRARYPLRRGVGFRCCRAMWSVGPRTRRGV